MNQNDTEMINKPSAASGLSAAAGYAFRHTEECYVVFHDGPMRGVYDARTPGEHWVYTFECGIDERPYARKWDNVYRTLEEATRAHKDYLHTVEVEHE